MGSGVALDQPHRWLVRSEKRYTAGGLECTFRRSWKNSVFVSSNTIRRTIEFVRGEPPRTSIDPSPQRRRTSPLPRGQPFRITLTSLEYATTRVRTSHGVSAIRMPSQRNPARRRSGDEGLAPHVHEDQDDQDRLDDRDPQRDRQVQGTEVDEGGADWSGPTGPSGRRRPSDSAFSRRCAHSFVQVDQVKQGVQEHPDDVDEVPVEPRQLQGRVVSG